MLFSEWYFVYQHLVAAWSSFASTPRHYVQGAHARKHGASKCQMENEKTAQKLAETQLKKLFENMTSGCFYST